MIEHTRLDDLVIHLAAAIRARGLYSDAHPLARKQVDRLQEAFAGHIRSEPSLAIAVLGTDVVIGRTRLAHSPALAWLARHLHERQIEKLTLARDLTRNGLDAMVTALANPDTAASTKQLASLSTRGVALGTIATEDAPPNAAGIAAARQLYGTVVTAAESLWGAAGAGDAPDPRAAGLIIDTLASAVSQDRGPMLALTTLKAYDTYTFTHMVNVAMLTMAQARALGISGPLLREFGLAGLMHDIGKVKTPKEILNKPDRLTHEETAIMRRHVIDGAQILRKTPELPALVPLVAFEHHLKYDLTGYPEHAGARTLNLCTMLVTIADAYDALRTKRIYRDAVPAARVRKLLADHSGTTFEPTLLKRFISLVGIFPVGTCVRLKTGEVAAVTAEHPTDAFRPVVRILRDAQGVRVSDARIIDTSAHDESGRHPYSVLEAVDAEAAGCDPLEVLA